MKKVHASYQRYISLKQAPSKYCDSSAGKLAVAYVSQTDSDSFQR